MPPTYLALLALHFIGLAMGVGAGFAMAALARASSDLEAGERVRFMLRAMAVTKNGSYGFLLLIVTGLSMLILRGPASVFAAGGPAFHAKLTLVVIMAGLIGYSQVLGKQAREANGGPAMAKLPKVGAAMMVVGLSIVVAAVIAFQ